MSKSLLDEMHEENVRLWCRCWDPPRDPNEIGHLEECPALAHRRHKHLNEQDTLKAERDEAVALLRAVMLGVWWFVPQNAQSKPEFDKARLFLTRIGGGQ